MKIDKILILKVINTFCILNLCLFSVSFAQNWKTDTSVDPITDDVTKFVYRENKSTSITGAASIGIACNDGYNAFLYIPSDFTGISIENEDDEIIVRFDNLPPKSFVFTRLEGGEVRMLFDDEVVNQAFLSTKVILRVTKFNGNTITDTFSLVGLKATYGRFIGKCE